MPQPAFSFPDRSPFPNGTHCPSTIRKPPARDGLAMSGDAAAAGFLLIGTMLLLGAAGYGIGSFADLGVLGGVVGLLIGVLVGLGLVYARFRSV